MDISLYVRSYMPFCFVCLFFLCSLLQDRISSWDFPSGPGTRTPCTQCRGPKFNPWAGNQIPHAATKSSHAAAKDPTTDGKPCVPQPRPGAAKQINIFLI